MRAFIDVLIERAEERKRRRYKKGNDQKSPVCFFVSKFGSNVATLHFQYLIETLAVFVYNLVWYGLEAYYQVSPPPGDVVVVQRAEREACRQGREGDR